MKYTHEVLDLMSAYPMRSFRMTEQVRHVTRGRALEARERDSARKAVPRVLDASLATGSVQVSSPQYLCGTLHVPQEGHEPAQGETGSGTTFPGSFALKKRSPGVAQGLLAYRSTRRTSTLRLTI